MNNYVDFGSKKSYTNSYPVSCIIKGKDIAFEYANWACLLIAITEYCINEENMNVDEFIGKPLYGNKPFFHDKTQQIGNYHELSNGKFIYTTYNSDTIIIIINKLLLNMNIDLNDVKITYYFKKEKLENTEQQQIFEGEYKEQENHFELAIAPATADVVEKVMTNNFRYGFRNDSIELTRFRQSSYNDYGLIIPLCNEQLVEYISSVGIISEKRIYLLANETKNKIKDLMSEVIDNNITICYYISFYNKHFGLLDDIGVISEGLLKEILVKMYPNYKHKQNYFSKKKDFGSELSLIKTEIIRVWGKDIVLSYEQLSCRLPFIPLEKIIFVLGQECNFIRNSNGVYSHTGRVILSEEQKTKIVNYITDAFKSKKYVSIYDLPLEEIQENNVNLSILAVQNAIFEILLSNDYVRRGRIISKKGNIFTIGEIMHEFCKIKEKCTLQDLFDLEIELTGKNHYYTSIDAGYNEMIRADKENFVSEKYVNFDTNRIDDAIEHFLIEDYVPLKRVITFAIFPHCNLIWNLFLLESYCRRFSNKFRFDVLSGNSSNVGVIIRKTCNLSYHQIMSDAVAKSDTLLNNKDVLKFLFESGYLGRQSYANTDDIIKQAIAINKRRK